MTKSAKVEGTFWNLIKDSHSIGFATHISHTLQPINSHYISLSNNLMGDPLIKPWKGIPSTQDSAFVEKGLLGTSVSGSNLQSRIIVRVPLNGGQPIVEKAEQNNILYRLPGGNYAISVLSPNSIPMLCKLHISGEDFSNYGYFYVSSAEIGTSSLINNNVTLKDGCDFTIKATGDIILGPNMLMQAGSKLTLITDGNVYIDHCQADPGAKLNITCTELNMTEGTLLPFSLWGDLNISNRNN